MTATIDLKAAATHLQEERVKVVHQMTDLGADESGELTGAVDYGDAFADGGAATAERTDIDAALAKIEDGTYGTCENCGNPIGEARMEFRPTSTRCVDCKNNA